MPGAGCRLRIADRCFPDGARRLLVVGRGCRRVTPGRDDHGSRSRLLVRQPRRRPGPVPGSRVRRRPRRGNLVDYATEGWWGYGRQRPWPAVRRQGARNGPAAPGCPPRGASCRNPPPARTPPATSERRTAVAGSGNDEAPPQGRRFVKSLGGDLLSHPASRAVPSALEGLTSGFGMGPGVSPPLWPPKRSGASGTPETSRTTQRARATRS